MLLKYFIVFTYDKLIPLEIVDACVYFSLIIVDVGVYAF